MTNQTMSEMNQTVMKRQFPQHRTMDLASLLRRIGPVQSQTPRSLFLGAAARSALTREQIQSDLASFNSLRATTIRGTVHTSDHRTYTQLTAAAAFAQQNYWRRALKLKRCDPHDVAHAVRRFSADRWRTVNELHSFLLSWLREHESEESACALANESGRYLSYGHIGLIRRPANGDWATAGATEYGDVETKGGEVAEAYNDEVAKITSTHLSSHGPATLQDVSWWSGINVTEVRGLASDLQAQGVIQSVRDNGEYFDVTESFSEGLVPECALLPEFDSLICGYHPNSRWRFLRPKDEQFVWNRKNGLCRPLLLFDGELVGVWKPTQTKAGRVDLTVGLFPGFKDPGRRRVRQAFESAERGMEWKLHDLTIGRASAMGLSTG